MAEMGDYLATIGMGQKLAMPPFLRGSWVPTEHNVAWSEAYLRIKSHLDSSSRWPQ